MRRSSLKQRLLNIFENDPVKLTNSCSESFHIYIYQHWLLFSVLGKSNIWNKEWKNIYTTSVEMRFSHRVFVLARIPFTCTFTASLIILHNYNKKP